MIPGVATLKLIGLGIGALLLCFVAYQVNYWKGQTQKARLETVQTKAAFDQTVANYRAAADKAAADDKANAERVAKDQAAINERTDHDFQTRLAAARDLASRLRAEAAAAATHPGNGNGAPVPRLPSTASVAAEAACNRLSDGSIADKNLCATEQAIQLDEAIDWMIAQHEVVVSPPPEPVPPAPKRKTLFHRIFGE